MPVPGVAVVLAFLLRFCGFHRCGWPLLPSGDRLFRSGASPLSSWLAVSSSEAGAFCARFSSILPKALILHENCAAATTGKTYRN